jgi:cell division protease FtsH
VKAAFDQAQAVLTERREILERGARQLLEKETLVEDDLRALTGRPMKKRPTATAAKVAR